MEALSIYLLKMLICSGLLFGYYRVALYNERFHHWNRFYLLAAMFFSVAAPVISIPLFTEKESVITMVSAMPWNTAGHGTPGQSTVDWQQIVLSITGVISICMFIQIVAGVWKLLKIYKQHPVNVLQGNVKLILTSLDNAPFSFFNWLFWRKDIDPASPNGQRMLAHEVTHIRQHHSSDKLYTQILLAVFWMNPFFWLMRRELNMIHEFLADKKAIAEQDGAAFAEMILQAIHVQPQNALTNPFFSSQLKRRLHMITISKKTQYSYLRRLCGLALMIGSAAALTLTVHEAAAQKQVPKTTVEKQTAGTADTARPSDKEWEAAAKRLKIKSDTALPLYILEGKEISATIMAAIKPETIMAISVIKNKDAVALYGQKARNGVVIITLKHSPPPDSLLPVSDGAAAAIFIKDGKRVSNDILKTLPASDIESVNVLKGQSAIDKYGEDGKNGAIEITTKNAAAPAIVFTKAEKMPAFPGGVEGWHMYLAQSLRYPQKAQEAGIQGPAAISFIVSENGELSGFEITENPGSGLGEEALRLIKTGPKWEPAVQNGHNVAASVRQTVTFKLE